MTFQKMTPMLRTPDLESTLKFYSEVVGFQTKSISKDNGWALIERDRIEIMFSRLNHHENDSKPAFTGSFYFRIKQADDLWDQVKDKARVCYPIESFSYGMREFGIYDNNGYLLQFGHPVT